MNQKEIKIETQIRAIELLSFSINAGNPTELPSEFNFSIGLESKADAVNKLAFVVVKIGITNKELSHTYGTMEISCVYEIKNFDEIITKDEKGNFVVPQPLVDLLNSVSLSTARGVLFSQLKGTYLHTAIMPIIDMKIVQQAQQHEL